MSEPMRAVCMGVHVLDVLVRPVEAIPEGQGGQLMGGEAAAKILGAARERGIVTSADVLAPGEMGVLDWIADALPHLDYFLPNDEQVLGFTGAGDLEAGCLALVERGVGCVAATCG